MDLLAIMRSSRDERDVQSVDVQIGAMDQTERAMEELTHVVYVGAMAVW